MPGRKQRWTHLRPEFRYPPEISRPSTRAVPSKQTSSLPPSLLPSFRSPEEAYTAVRRIHNHRFRSDAGVHPSVNVDPPSTGGMAEEWTRSEKLEPRIAELDGEKEKEEKEEGEGERERERWTESKDGCLSGRR